MIFLKNEDNTIFHHLMYKSINENYNNRILIEVIKKKENFNDLTENFTNNTHNLIYLGKIIESPSQKYFNEGLDDDDKIVEFTFIIHKNYIKQKLKSNDIIYFQKNIDGAEKILYLIIHSIKTNPKKSDYFDITIKDKSNIIKEKEEILRTKIINMEPYKHVNTYDISNKNDFRIVKIGTNRQNFLLSKKIKLIKENDRYFIKLSSDDINENIENIKPFKPNDSLIIHSKDGKPDEKNLLIESISKDKDNNQVIALNINSTINEENLTKSGDDEKEILIEINNFEKMIKTFMETPRDDYVRLKWSQSKINRLIKKVNELNYQLDYNK